MSQIKLKDFLLEKLNNFKIFTNTELDRLSGIHDSINLDNITKFNNQIDFFLSNIDLFIEFVKRMDKQNIDVTIKNFLSNYDIDIDKYKIDIDYDKIKIYILCFMEVVQN